MPTGAVRHEDPRDGRRRMTSPLSLSDIVVIGSTAIYVVAIVVQVWVMILNRRDKRYLQENLPASWSETPCSTDFPEGEQ